jgi:hypothetical protein
MEMGFPVLKNTAISEICAIGMGVAGISKFTTPEPLVLLARWGI